jgi:Sec-independent protein translocase protein TatA
MKHRKLCLAILLGAVLIFGAAGCSNAEDTDAKTQTEAKEEQKDSGQENKETSDKESKKEDTKTDKKENTEAKENPDETAKKDTEKDADKNSADTQEPEEKNTPVQAGQAFIYVPDDNAEGWNVNQVEIAQVTADALIGQLVGAGVLTDSITVQNFEETEEEGQYVLKLDLSSNFKDSVRSMGTAGEILTIGAVVNSFLDTFQAEAIQITVDGGTLETGHEVYEGYMTHMDYQ